MLRHTLAASGLVIAFGLGAPAATSQPDRLTDAEIADRVIAQSIARYSGNCPCPYSRMRNGRRCGGVSAYSRPGGASPLCYRRDVTPAMIKSYRRGMERR